MVVIERRWQLHMLMKLATARNHLQHQMNLWVGSVLSISHQAQQLVNSVGTGSQTIVLIEKVASRWVMSRIGPATHFSYNWFSNILRELLHSTLPMCNAEGKINN
jgi:hypothetical protein